MKFLIVFALFAASAYAAFDAEFKAKVMEKVQEVGAECATIENASADDIGEIMAKKTPSTKEGKCMMACFQEKFGVIGADGKFNLEAAIKSLECFEKADPEIYAKMKAIIEKCIPQVGDAGDRCENAVQLAHCSKVEAMAVGLDDSEIM